MTDQLREKSLSLLALRPHSRHELSRKLVQKGNSETEAEEVCDWLTELGFLDDRNYALSVARRYGEKGYGPQRIRSELSRRGVPREFWEEALTEAPDSSGKVDRYLLLKMKNPEDGRERQKLSAALVRRGYSREEIRAAFERVADANTDSDWTD